MADQKIYPGQETMKFTAEMTTSITHELKNKLAVVNENAGLIQDLLFMGKQGRAVDMERFETISQKIQEQVRLADTIIKKLNGFAQSMEESETETDVAQALKSVLSLTAHLIEKYECEIAVTAQEAPWIINADPFCFKHLLWTVIKSVCASEGNTGPVHISLDKEASSLVFRFNGNKKEICDEINKTTALNILAKQMEIKVRTIKDHNGIGIFWSSMQR